MSERIFSYTVTLRKARLGWRWSLALERTEDSTTPVEDRRIYLESNTAWTGWAVSLNRAKAAAEREIVVNVWRATVRGPEHAGGYLIRQGA